MFTSSTDLLRSVVAGKYFLRKTDSGPEDAPLFIADAPDGTPVHVRLARVGSPVAESWPAIAATSAALDHPNLLRYLDAGDTSIDGQPWHFIATELVSDRVADVLTDRALTPEETDAVVRAAIEALDYLHEHGYAHRDLSPEAIVAASDQIKLTGARIAPLPADEASARRALSSDLLALGETATMLLTRARGPEAAATLPVPFAEFVRATAGNSSCPHPTARQLLAVLDGGELIGTAPVVPAAADLPARPEPEPEPAIPVSPPSAAVHLDRDPEPEPEPVRVFPAPPADPERAPAPPRPEPVAVPASETANWSPERHTAARRNGTVLLAMLGISVLALIFWLVLRPKSEPPATATAAPQPRPAVETPTRARAPEPRTAAPALRGEWGVVAATYAEHSAALKRAEQLARQSRMQPVVLPAAGQGTRYYVILGSAPTRKEAERIRSQARAAGMPRDTYVTRLRF